MKGTIHTKKPYEGPRRRSGFDRILGQSKGIPPARHIGAAAAEIDPKEVVRFVNSPGLSQLGPLVGGQLSKCTGVFYFSSIGWWI